MAKIVPLHDLDALALPLDRGAALRVTPFHHSARIALTLHGPDGGNAGGVILNASRARLLGSWLMKLAESAGPSRTVAARRDRRAPARARSAGRPGR